MEIGAASRDSAHQLFENLIWDAYFLPYVFLRSGMVHESLHVESSRRSVLGPATLAATEGRKSQRAPAEMRTAFRSPFKLFKESNLWVISQSKFLSATRRASRAIKRERTLTESSHPRLNRWPPGGAAAGGQRRMAGHHQARRGGGTVDTHR